MKNPARRVALYGGSFDPVHPAHVAIARAAVDQAELHEVIFLPAAQSPLKEKSPQASGEDRVEMLKVALHGISWAKISDWELKHSGPGPSYSWQTLEHFLEHEGPEESIDGEDQDGLREWFWLMGVDQWMQLERWKRWEYLAEHLTFLVFTRDGIIPQPRPGVKSVFLSGEFQGSSTEIRAARLIRNDNRWESLVHPGVADLIRRRGLYQK